MTVAVSLTIGAGMVGNLGVTIGNVTLGGIGVVTFVAIVLYQILREPPSQPEEVAVDAARERHANSIAEEPSASEEGS